MNNVLIHTLTVDIDDSLKDLPEGEKNRIFLRFDHMLSDFEFDPTDLNSPQPDFSQILLNYLAEEDLTGVKDQVWWLHALTLHFIQKSETSTQRGRYLDFATQAHDLAFRIRQEPEKINRKIAEYQVQVGKAVNKKLNAKKYLRIDKLKQAIFAEYPNALAEARSKGKVTYDSIIRIIWPKIEHLNKHPKIDKPLIGKNGDPHATVQRWLREAIKENRIESMR